jgi:hypothetical protein
LVAILAYFSSRHYRSMAWSPGLRHNRHYRWCSASQLSAVSEGFRRLHNIVTTVDHGQMSATAAAAHRQ